MDAMETVAAVSDPARVSTRMSRRFECNESGMFNVFSLVAKEFFVSEGRSPPRRTLLQENSKEPARRRRYERQAPVTQEIPGRGCRLRRGPNFLRGVVRVLRLRCGPPCAAGDAPIPRRGLPSRRLRR